MATTEEIRLHLRKNYPDLNVGIRGPLSFEALLMAAHDGLLD